MTDVVAGIKEEELRSLSLEILRYHDDVGALFSEINVYMKELPNCYQGPPCDKIMARYEKLSAQYPIVKSNLKNYAKDLQAVITAMREGEKKLASLFNTFTSDTQQEIKSNKEIISQEDINNRRNNSWQI